MLTGTQLIAKIRLVLESDEPEPTTHHELAYALLRRPDMQLPSGIIRR